MSQPPTSGTPSGSAPVEPPRKKRPAWLIPLVAAVVVLLLLLLLSQCAGGDDEGTAGTDDTAGSGATAGATSVPSTAVPSTEASPTPSVTIEETTTPTTGATASPSASADGSSATAGGGDAGADAALVTAGGTAVLPLVGDPSGAGLASVDGQDVQATGVPVESVPADEGFWVGSADQRVWVQLDGQGESVFEVEAGEQLDFTGQVVANDEEFLASVGLEDGEGLDQLQQQGFHLLVDRDTIEAVG